MRSLRQAIRVLARENYWDELRRLKLVRVGFQRFQRDEIPAFFRTAFDMNGETSADTLLELIHGKSQIAFPADHGAVFRSVAHLVGITACAGVQEGQHLRVQFDHEKTDVLALIRIGEKLRDLRFKRANVDDGVAS